MNYHHQMCCSAQYLYNCKELLSWQDYNPIWLTSGVATLYNNLKIRNVINYNAVFESWVESLWENGKLVDFYWLFPWKYVEHCKPSQCPAIASPVQNLLLL